MSQTLNGQSNLAKSNNVLLVGLIPLVIFAVLITFLAVLNPFGRATYNPPSLLPILNAVFVTGTGIVVSILSGVSYYKSGNLNMLLLGCGVLAIGLASLIGGLAANVLANYGVTTHNTGMLLTSALQLASAIVTLMYISPNQLSTRKKALSIGYAAIIGFFIAWTLLTLNNYTPLFFTQIGPTLLRQIVLGLVIAFLSASSLLIFMQYLRSKATGLYWYAIALALFAIGMISIVFQQVNADAFVWVGRTAQYAGGFYFIIAILSLRNPQERGISLTESWVGMFGADRRQLSQFLSKLTEAYIYGRIVLDKQGKPIDWIYLDVNERYESIQGKKKNEVIARKATEVYPTIKEDPANWIEDYGRVALTGESESFEKFAQFTCKWYHLSVYSPKYCYFIVIFDDITDRKVAEEQLKLAQGKLEEHARNLEELVEKRTRELRDSERLATIGQTAGMVGHDIRNPLQAIVSELFLAKDEIVKSPDSPGKQATIDSLNFIQEQVDYINKIVADLQDFARNTKPSLTNVNLKDVIDSTFASISIPENIEASCSVQNNPTIMSDPNYLRRIITNLSTNAIQAMPNGGKLRVVIKLKEETVQIAVSDTGEGIPEELKPMMFKPLFTTKSKGQGFGLAVVKKFVEQLSGEITFDSQKGKGTTFTILLPANSPTSSI